MTTTRPYGRSGLSALRAPSVPCAGLLLAALSFGWPPAARAQAEAASLGTLRVVAWNIRHGRGTDDRVDLERVAEVLRGLDADVIALQEVDDRTQRTNGVDQVAELARLLRYEGYHGPHRDFEGGRYGNAVLTRLPVLSEEVHAIPPASGSALAVHELVVALPPPDGDRGVRGLPVSVISVHLSGTPEERTAQAGRVTEIAQRSPWRPTILAGDLNGRPDDPAVGRLRASWTFPAKSGDARTYPAQQPDREIDYVAWRVNPRLVDFTVAVVEHRVVEEAVASDHRPLLAVFDFRR